MIIFHYIKVILQGILDIILIPIRLLKVISIISHWVDTKWSKTHSLY